MNKKANRILITGATGGIGRALAGALAASGTELIIHGRNESALEMMAEEIIKSGGTVKVTVADISTPEGVDSLIGKIGEATIDTLIHAAGVAYIDDVANIKQNDWEKSLAVNVTAPFLITRKLLPAMRPGSSIVFILSVAAKTAFPSWGSYCTAKFGLDGFAKVLREELRPRKIRVISVYPSATATAIWDNIPGQWSKENMLKPSAVAEAVKFALQQDESTVVENISLGNIGGNQ